MACQTSQPESHDSESMDYYITYQEEIVEGPFETEEDARAKAMEIGKQKLKNEDDESFISSFRIRPEWWCINDPENTWNICNIHIDHHYSIAEYSNGTWEVGVFNDDGKVVDNKIETASQMGDVLSILCSYLTQHQQKVRDGHNRSTHQSG